MQEKHKGKIDKCTFIKRFGDVDLVEFQIGFDLIKAWGDFSEYNQLVDKPVWYTTRIDIIDGQSCLVVAQIAEIKKVNVVEKVDNIKLIPIGNKRDICNFSISTIRNGDFIPACVALLCSWESRSSAKTTWIDCKMIDADSREFVLRIFTRNIKERAEKSIDSWVGKYVSFDLKATQYGYQTEEISPMLEEIVLSPEVEVAKTILMNEIVQDDALISYEKANSLLNILMNTIDGEPGYMLVRMASEIFMINSLENISSNFSTRSMKRAVICSRGYLKPHQKPWSKSMFNTNLAIKVKELGDDTELIAMLDVATEAEISPTKQLYITIRNMVDDIIKIRRGNYVKENIVSDISQSSFGGLL